MGHGPYPPPTPGGPWPSQGPPNPRDAKPGRGSGESRQPYWWAQQPQWVVPATSGLAVASLVLSILWIGGIGSLLAVIFGAVALSRINHSYGRLKGTGLAIAGLVIGSLGLLLAIASVAVIATVGREALSNRSLRFGQAAVLSSPAADGVQSLAVESFHEPIALTTGFGNPVTPSPGKVFAEVVVKACAGAGGSQTGPETTDVQLDFPGGGTAAPGFYKSSHPLPLTYARSMHPNQCVIGSITYEVVRGTKPASVAWAPDLFGPTFQWPIK
jgi:hypothetical protein